MLSPDDLAAVAAIFNDAVDLDPEARAALLESRCGSRDDIRAEVHSLLAAHERLDAFMEPPAGAGDQPTPPDGVMLGAWRLGGKIGSGSSFSMTRCARVPMMRSLRSLSNPFITASVTMSAATPTEMPSTEIVLMMPTNAWRRLDQT